MSVDVSNTMTTRRTTALAQIIPQYRQMDGQGKRKLLTPDEVLRLPNNQMLCIVRGCNILVLEKMDYTKHPYAKNVVRTSIMDYSPIAPSDSSIEMETIVFAKTEEKPKRKNKVKEIYVDLPLDSV
jgi:type IV secretion system protein VirD4